MSEVSSVDTQFGLADPPIDADLTRVGQPAASNLPEPVLTTITRPSVVTPLRRQAAALRVVSGVLIVTAGCAIQRSGLGWLLAAALVVLAVGLWQVANHQRLLATRSERASAELEAMLRRRLSV
ncbi:MAG: hypothetical protein IT204_07120 [Fimbriimonadaceae bacterium]|nr:hypothetical protein [Fimbriimonadaceae bacterium]